MCSVEKHCGLGQLIAAAKAGGVHFVGLTDDNGNVFVAAGLNSFRTLRWTFARTRRPTKVRLGRKRTLALGPKADVRSIRKASADVRGDDSCYVALCETGGGERNPQGWKSTCVSTGIRRLVAKSFTAK